MECPKLERKQPTTISFDLCQWYFFNWEIGLKERVPKWNDIDVWNERVCFLRW